MTTEKPSVADHIRQPNNDDAESLSANQESGYEENASHPDADTQELKSKQKKPIEIGGPKGLEPTRYGDWEAKGRCYDF